LGSEDVYKRQCQDRPVEQVRDESGAPSLERCDALPPPKERKHQGLQFDRQQLEDQKVYIS
jgi:hypothetical protein